MQHEPRDEPGERSSKRLRGSDSDSDPLPQYARQADVTPKRVFLSCSLDEPDKFIEADYAVLATYSSCRLLKQIQHDRPRVDPGTGRHYHSVHMTRPMLQCFLRSLVHGELSLSKNVTVAEAHATFEYENVQIGIPPAKVGDVAVERIDRMVRPVRDGACHEKRMESAREIIVRTCEQVAEAIAHWPALEEHLDSVLEGTFYSYGFSSTRGWMRFASKPMLPTIDSCSSHSTVIDTIANLANKWPRWLQIFLYAVGHVQQELALDGNIDPKSRDEAAFVKMQRYIQSDPLGSFFTLRYDSIDSNKGIRDTKFQKRHVRAQRFVNEMRNTVTEGTNAEHVAAKLRAANEIHNPAPAPAADNALAFGAPALPNQQPQPQPQPQDDAEQPPRPAFKQKTIPSHFGMISLGGGPLAKPEDAIKFARGWLGFAEGMLHKTPSLVNMFTGRVLDEKGSSFERQQLAKALASRGVKVVRWEDSVTAADSRGIADLSERRELDAVHAPLVFPSTWRRDGSDRGSRWAGVLLDFSGVR